MRVLHIYSGNFYGGVESFLVTLARWRALCPAMDPHFALAFDGKLYRDLLAAGVQVHLLGAVRVSRPITVFQARRALKRLLASEPFDLVICHSPWPHSLFAPVVRSARVPLVFWLHDATGGRHWSERWARRTPPDLAVANSEFTLGTLHHIFKNVPAIVIHSPVGTLAASWTPEELAEARHALGTAPGEVAIIQPSRMEEWKGHRLHLEALSLLKDVPNWVCWMVGRPQRPYEERYYRALQDDAQRYGIAQRVRFPGWVPDLHQLLAAAQIHCQPNTGPEPLGLTFLEAMAAKLPVVTTAIGGALEIVGADSGILVPANDPRALADALEALIRDPARRSALGAGGPGRVRQLCDPETQLNKLAAALGSIASRSQAAA